MALPLADVCILHCGGSFGRAILIGVVVCGVGVGQTTIKFFCVCRYEQPWGRVGKFFVGFSTENAFDLRVAVFGETRLNMFMPRVITRTLIEAIIIMREKRKERFCAVL